MIDGNPTIAKRLIRFLNRVTLLAALEHGNSSRSDVVKFPPIKVNAK